MIRAGLGPAVGLTGAPRTEDKVGDDPFSHEAPTTIQEERERRNAGRFQREGQEADE